MTTVEVAATLKTAPLPSVEELTPIASLTDTKTEAYWRGRLRPLTAQLTADLLLLEPIDVR